MLDPQLVAAAIVAVEVNAEILRGVQGEEGPEGPKGDKGDPGPQGATGQKGDKGNDGVTGPEGPQGKRGQRGPQGERGLQGTKGDKGDKGERGPAGAGNMFPRPAGGGGGSGSGSALTVKDEGVNLDTAVTSIDFTGAGVTATNIGHAITVAVTGSGSGAPFPPWTEGGHGDVTATVDAGETDPTLVILATTDQEAVTAHLFEIQDSNASRVFYIDNEDLSGPGGTMRFGPVDSSPGGLDTSFLVTWDDNTNVGNVIAEVRSQDSFIELDSFLDKNTSTNSYSQIQIAAAADQTRPTIRVTNRGTGARVFGVLAAGSPVFAQIVTPADGDFSASEVGFWFDDTNGSAAPQWKGKQADGTVVSGSLGGGTPFPPWTEGGHGDVVATTDDGSVPLTVAGELIVNPIGTDTYGLLIQGNDPDFWNVYNAWFRIIDPDGVHALNVDSGGIDMMANSSQGDQVHMLFRNEAGDQAGTLSSSTGLNITRSDAGALLLVSEQYGFGMNSFVPSDAPADNRVQMYHDSTADSPSMHFRGKDANSTAFAREFFMGTTDPSAGAGVAADEGSQYNRDNAGTGELWVKTGTADTAWTKFGAGVVGGADYLYLIANYR